MLLLQAAQVLRSAAFASTLRAAVKLCAGVAAGATADSIRAALSDPLLGTAAAECSIAVPRVVPLLANVPQGLLAEGSAAAAGLLGVPEVKALLRDVYARGPFVGGAAQD